MTSPWPRRWRASCRGSHPLRSKASCRRPSVPPRPRTAAPPWRASAWAWGGAAAGPSGWNAGKGKQMIGGTAQERRLSGEPTRGCPRLRWRNLPAAAVCGLAPNAGPVRKLAAVCGLRSLDWELGWWGWSTVPQGLTSLVLPCASEVEGVPAPRHGCFAALAELHLDLLRSEDWIGLHALTRLPSLHTLETGSLPCACTHAGAVSTAAAAHATRALYHRANPWRHWRGRPWSSPCTPCPPWPDGVGRAGSRSACLRIWGRGGGGGGAGR